MSELEKLIESIIKEVEATFTDNLESNFEAIYNELSNKLDPVLEEVKQSLLDVRSEFSEEVLNLKEKLSSNEMFIEHLDKIYELLNEKLEKVKLNTETNSDKIQDLSSKIKDLQNDLEELAESQKTAEPNTEEPEQPEVIEPDPEEPEQPEVIEPDPEEPEGEPNPKKVLEIITEKFAKLQKSIASVKREVIIGNSSFLKKIRTIFIGLLLFMFRDFIFAKLKDIWNSYLDPMVEKIGVWLKNNYPNLYQKLEDILSITKNIFNTVKDISTNVLSLLEHWGLINVKTESGVVLDDRYGDYEAKKRIVKEDIEGRAAARRGEDVKPIIDPFSGMPLYVSKETLANAYAEENYKSFYGKGSYKYDGGYGHVSEISIFDSKKRRAQIDEDAKAYATRVAFEEVYKIANPEEYAEKAKQAQLERVQNFQEAAKVRKAAYDKQQAILSSSDRTEQFISKYGYDPKYMRLPDIPKGFEVNKEKQPWFNETPLEILEKEAGGHTNIQGSNGQVINTVNIVNVTEEINLNSSDYTF